MSGSLKRALGLWAANQVSGLYVYADDLANANHHYPSCVVTELSGDTIAVGCGRKDYKVKDEQTGYTVVSGKMHRSERVYRLTVSAPSDSERNGQEIVDAIIDELEKRAFAIWLSISEPELIDDEADPPESFKLQSLKPVGRQSIPPDITGEPFLYRTSLSLRLVFALPVERPVEHVFKNIHVED